MSQGSAYGVPIDTDPTLAADSDQLVPSQKAIKSYVDNGLSTVNQQGISGSNGSFSFSTVTFGNLNGLSFYTSNGSMVGSYTVPSQSNQTIGIYASSNTTMTSFGTIDARSLSFRGIGVASVGYSNNEVLISVPAGGGGITNINLSAGTTSNNASNFTFADSNGISFGLNAGTITATVKTDYLTTARASNDAIGLNTAQSNVTWTVNSAGLSLDASGYAGTQTGGTNASLTVNSNGVSVSVAAPVTTNGLLSAINVSAGTTSNNLSAFTFNNANGITFGLNASTVTASHNGLTTARASNDGVGLNTAQTNVTWTVNSAGLSLNASGYAGTGTSATNASITLNSDGLKVSVAAPGGGYTLRDWDNFGVIQTMNLITNLTATGVTQRPIFFPMEVDGYLTWNRGMFELSKVTNSQNYAFTVNFGIYSFANSTSINLIASLQNVYDISSASSVSATGIRRFAFSGIGAAGSTLTPGRYVGMLAFSAAATSGMNASLRGGVTANPPLGLIGAGTNALSTANLSSIYLRQFRGVKIYSGCKSDSYLQMCIFFVQNVTIELFLRLYLCNL